MNMRHGIDVAVCGILFTLHEWQFCEDGWAGAIYFHVPAETFKAGGNNGFSVEDVDPAFKGGPPIQRVRCATPCMTDDNPASYVFNVYIRDAAEGAMMNLEKEG